MLAWGESGGGGVGTGVGSPEAAWAKRALDDPHPGPPDEDPPPRPGCLRGALIVALLIVAMIASLWLLGVVLGALS